MYNIKLWWRGAERFVVSLLALTSFWSYNKRICGSLIAPCSPKCSATPRTSHTRQLGERTIGEDNHVIHRNGI